MVQPAETQIFNRLNVDFLLGVWYDEYVGRPVGCLFSFPPQTHKKYSQPGAWRQKKWPLTVCSFLRTSFSVKGHFCSFLLSNIIGYLTFLNLDFCFFIFFFPLSVYERICFCLISSIDMICRFFIAIQILVFEYDFCFCPFFDSRCWGILSDP